MKSTTPMRKTAVILPAVFITAVAIGLLQLGMVFYLREVKSFSAGSIGLFAAVWWLSYSVACILMRPVSARLLPRVSVILATFFVGAFILLLITVGGTWLIYLFYAAAGFSLSLFWPPVMGWLSYGLEGPELNLAMSRFNLSWSLGMVVSPYTAGLLSERAPALPIFTAVGLFFGVSVLVLTASLAVPSIRADRYRDPRRKRTAVVEDRSTFLRFPAWIGILSIYFVFGVVFNVFPLFATEQLALSKSIAGILLLVRALATTAAFLLLGRISFWHFKPGYMIGSQAMLVLILIGLLLSGSMAPILLLLAILGVFGASNYVASLFYGVSGSSERSRRMAVHESLLAFGVIAGSAVGGMLYQRVGMNAVYGMCAALLAAGLGAQLLLLLNGRARKIILREERT